jgi:hypothetical protein
MPVHGMATASEPPTPSGPPGRAASIHARIHMTNRLLLVSAMAAAIAISPGCSDARTSDYPDGSVNTTRRVDDVMRNARDKKDAVDQEADQLSMKLDFRERQIRESYKAKRQSSANAAAGSEAEREGKSRGIRIQAKHDKGAIDAEAADERRNSPAEQSAAIQAAADSRKAEVDSDAVSRLSPIASETERSKSKDAQGDLELDRDESKEISALEQERSQARNEVKVRKLEIDTWVTAELARIEKESHASAE